ncbi:MAG: hypothetical protein IH911_05870 [Proteobacteria bacterium]|nr:hypothetical protein [Pseudomonadota bacterium]
MPTVAGRRCGRALVTQALRALLVLVTCAVPITAWAHGFAERYDLPVPLHLYMGGAAAAVALSFVVVAYFVRGDRTVRRYPTFNVLGTAAGRLITGPVVRFVLRLFALFMLVLVVVAGLIGDSDPFNNIAPTTVWVIWWVGFAYISGMLGDLWALLNPWRTVYEVAEWLFVRFKPNRRLGLNMNYPRGLASWPAVVLFVWFIWAELIWPNSDSPADLSQIVITYSLITWSGMLVFGSANWLRHGEVFTILFGLLARFAPTEYVAERREWNLRPWAVGLLPDKPMSVSLTVFVLLMLSSVTFDGLLATPLWAEIAPWLLMSDLVRPLVLLLQDVTGDAIAAIGTIALVAFLLVFQLLYLAFCGLMYVVTPARARVNLSVGELARLFVLSLVPIALAYHLAHYLSFLLIVGQYMIPMASDPFGFGWDLFGTSLYMVNIGVVGAKFVWITSVIAIVTGHIVAVWLAHVVALRRLRDSGAALRSQIPMLFLMVSYTMLSLWILAQPVVETS